MMGWGLYMIKDYIECYSNEKYRDLLDVRERDELIDDACVLAKVCQAYKGIILSSAVKTQVELDHIDYLLLENILKEQKPSLN